MSAPDRGAGRGWDDGGDRQGPAPSRRRVLAAGAVALALAPVPGVARAATAGRQAAGRSTEPQSRPQQGRVLASLNGTWDFMPTTGTPATPPDTGTWSPIPVPAEWNMTAGNFATAWGAYDLFETPADWNSVDVAWYRRTVDVPAAQRGQRIVLRFEAVNFEATVFFNGTKVALHSGGLLPFEADVTDQVNWGGTNTVHVLVRSGNAAARQSDGWHYPNGSWWGQTCWGIWQDVWLLARPATGGSAGDTYSVRFGFREVAVNGTDILLNGEPVMLRGDAWHYMGSVENSRAYATAWFTMVKALGVNYLRLHAMPYPPVFYDVADEMGLLLVAESGIYGSSGNYALSAADFWDNCVTHLTDRVLRDRNHPSVFAWSAENEMLAAFGQSWAAKVAALKPVVTALDTTRPVYFEGDGDPQGTGDLESTHYPWEITTSNTAIPESAYALAPGGQNAGFWDRKKPMLIGEFSSMYYATPAQVSAIGGPATYADLDGLWSAHALIVGAQIEGFRYAGTTGVSPWNTVWYGMRHLAFDPAKESLPLPEATGPKLLQVGRYATTLNPGFEKDLPAWQPNPIHDAVARVMSATAALATDYRTHFWGGGTLTRTYAVYDEVGTQRTVTVSWELKLSGAGTTRGSQRVAVPPDGKADVTFDIAVPAVKRTTAGTLTVRVDAGGPALYQHPAPVTVYPSSAGQRTSKAPLAAAVIEAAGSTATSDALADLGVTTRTITDLSSLPAGQEVLVLGEGATVNATPDQTAAVTAFIQGGGRVLSFAQQRRGGQRVRPHRVHPLVKQRAASARHVLRRRPGRHAHANPDRLGRLAGPRRLAAGRRHPDFTGRHHLHDHAEPDRRAGLQHDQRGRADDSAEFGDHPLPEDGRHRVGARQLRVPLRAVLVRPVIPGDPRETPPHVMGRDHRRRRAPHEPLPQRRLTARRQR